MFLMYLFFIVLLFRVLSDWWVIRLKSVSKIMFL
jgi:hypothetical protein